MSTFNDELKELEEREERKWSNLERIQQRMAARQKIRKPPRQTEFEKKKKLKNIENPEWKAKFEKEKAEKERLIAEKYKEEMKRKRKLEKEKEMKEKKLLEQKWKEEAKKNKSGLKEKPPDIKQWNKNFAKQQYETQMKIEEKYKLKKQKDQMSRKEFKKKAAEIEERYDSAKPKKKKRDPNKKAIVIDDEHNAWSAVERNDFVLLDRIYSFYPNDIKKKDKQGNTILHHAIRHYERRRNNNVKLIEYLIPKLPKTYMNATNYLGNTPLTIAVYERKFECIRALYTGPSSCRPNLDHININGRTVLMHAAMRDDVELMEILLNECQPKPTIDLIADKNSKSALTYAVEHSKINAAKMLLEHGANFYIKNKFGKNARDMASGSVMRCILDQERVNVVKGLVMSPMIRNLNLPDYLITIIAQYITAPPQQLLDEEKKEKEDAKKKKKKKKKTRTATNRNRNRNGNGNGNG